MQDIRSAIRHLAAEEQRLKQRLNEIHKQRLHLQRSLDILEEMPAGVNRDAATAPPVDPRFDQATEDWRPIEERLVDLCGEGGVLNSAAARRTLIEGGLLPGDPIPAAQRLWYVLNRSDRFQKIGRGQYRLISTPRVIATIGEVVFNHEHGSGLYRIGSGELEFETMWSKANRTAVHVYRDPESIDGVAVARGCTSISQVREAEALDYHSRTQMPSCGEVVVLRNSNGYYAAIQIVEIKDSERGDDTDELRFRYAIQPDRSGNFEEFADL